MYHYIDHNQIVLMVQELISAGFIDISLGYGPDGNEILGNSVWVGPSMIRDKHNRPKQWSIVPKYLGQKFCGNGHNSQCENRIPEYLIGKYYSDTVFEELENRRMNKLVNDLQTNRG